MSSTSTSAEPVENKPTEKPETPAFPFEGARELVSLPYRTMFDLLRRNHTSALEMLNIHRKCADDLREIFRSQQDLFFNLSERVLNRLSGIGTDKEADNLYGKTLEDLQETTLATMREIGAAVAAAQASSFEALSHQMHSGLPESSNGHGRETSH